MANTQKDTIYIDIDDEITAVIDKVKNSQHKIVALVLPKRATVFQSIVNMKLLKRSAANAKKNIVLITSDQNLLPLAGAVGLHVAKNLQTKPSVPDAPEVRDQVETVDEPIASPDAAHVDPTKSIGELASAAGLMRGDGEESLEIDNVAAASEAVKKPEAKKAAASSAGKKLKIPDFIRFRKRLSLGIGAALLVIILWFVAFWVMPTATIRIVTNTEDLAASVTANIDTAATALDIDDAVVPAALAEDDNEASEKVTATGKKEVGDKASGNVVFHNCQSLFPITIDSGTAVSNGGLNYITQEAVTVPGGTGDFGGCTTPGVSEQVEIVAAAIGEDYNVGSGADFSVAGYDSDMSATSASDIDGGSKRQVTVVSEDDLKKGAEQIATSAADGIKAQLKLALEQQGLFALVDTFQAEAPKVTSSPKVGEEASEVTVTATTKYSMLGANSDALSQLVEDSVKDKIDTSRQAVLDSGLNEAVFRVEERESDGKATVLIQSTVVAGPQIDTEGIRHDMAGKKRGEIERLIGEMPGVEEVIVDYSPLWVYSTPKSAAKITVVVEDSGE